MITDTAFGPQNELSEFLGTLSNAAKLALLIKSFCYHLHI